MTAATQYTRETIVQLLSNMQDGKEIRSYLQRFAAVDQSRFAVIKIGGAILQEQPYKFRYSLRIIPVEKVVRTDLDEVKCAAEELSLRIRENETFRVTVEKRFTSIHSRDFIKAAATSINRKVDLENPDKILLIEVVGGLTGLSLIKPSDVLTVVKEKLL
mgnify:CR=1 FL=1